MVKVGLLIGGLVAVGGYLFACYRNQKQPETVSCIEAILLGAGVPSGLHLIYCAFFPEQLFHLTYLDGRQFDLAENQLMVHISDMHAIEIMLGGFVGAFFCCVGIFSIWKKPGGSKSESD
jgi:phosphotransferase system  glucose/maltose/N-acetylglucosamine-specific IIC component